MGKFVCFTLTIVGFGAAFLLGLPNIYGSSPEWPLFILILGVITAFGGAFIPYSANEYSLIKKMARMAIFLFFICFAGSTIIMVFGLLNFYKNINISLLLILMGLIGGFISAFSIIDLEKKNDPGGLGPTSSLPSCSAVQAEQLRAVALYEEEPKA